jgi:NAD(P)-dependent dehydrogenase (short-subunit alcohol dehydrogenase family)
MLKTILITGCSSGIGLCAAETLHQKGYRVFAAARKQADVDMLRAKGIESLILDVSDSDSIKKGLTEVLEKTGGTLDALFNNAGYAVPGAVEDISRDMMREQFETNVFGTMELTNLVIPVMRRQGHGRIIQNSSILAVVTMPFRGAYNASKFALDAFSCTLRQELRGSNIQVSIIAPGPIESRFRVNAGKSYQENLAGKNSEYLSVYQKMLAGFKNSQASIFTLPADAVVKKLLDALESSRPKMRYYVGFPAHLFAFLRRILPEPVLDAILVKTMKEEASHD